MLRGPSVAVPVFRGNNTVSLSAKNINKFSADGWVDLRPSNMRLWKAMSSREFNLDYFNQGDYNL